MQAFARDAERHSPWKSPRPGPLSGVRVIDVSHVLAGPYATEILALLGADVIKIEKPGVGDSIRDLGTRPERSGLQPSFLGCNAAKRSMAVDLAAAEGVQIVRKLSETADVFVENFRPGKIAALGLGADELEKANPRLVYCSISAWGQTGPLAPLGGYDHVMQAATGMMMLQGDDPNAPPIKVGFPIIDMATALMGALAITASIAARRGGGLAPERLDVSMADAALFMMAPLACAYTGDGQTPARVGNRGFTTSPGAAVFRTSDGWISTAANTLAQFDAMCRVLARPELATAPDYLKRRPDNPTSMLRGLGTPRLDAALADIFQTRSALAWEADFVASGVPAAAVRTLSDYIDGPYRLTGGISVPVAGADGASVETFAPGFRRNGKGFEGGTAPRLGEDSDAVLSGLGFTVGEINLMRSNGVVA